MKLNLTNSISSFISLSHTDDKVDLANIFDLRLSFRTTQENGILVSAGDTSENSLVVELVEGKVGIPTHWYISTTKEPRSWLSSTLWSPGLTPSPGTLCSFGF